tara:strand:- start:2755 stop:3069 length:315 start_codon:yes stop_codon:yes gene_type:complete
MIVKIQHSIDIDEVPDKVDDLISDARRRLVSATGGMEAANIGNIKLQVADVEQAIEYLSSIRKKLLMADSLLEDSSYILKEWYSAKMQMVQTKEEPPRAEDSDE